MTAWDFERAASVRDKIDGLDEAASSVQDAAASAGVDVPASVRQAYEQAEHDEQYAALATALPKAAAAVPPVAAAQAAAAEDVDPVTAFGATVLGVEDRAMQAGTALDDGRYDEARVLAVEATDRADRSTLVGLGVLLLGVLVLVGITWFGWRTVQADARRREAAEAERAALLRTFEEDAGRPTAP